MMSLFVVSCLTFHNIISLSLDEDNQRESQAKQKLIDDLKHKVAALEELKLEAINERRASELEHNSQKLEQEALWRKEQEEREQEIKKMLEVRNHFIDFVYIIQIDSMAFICGQFTLHDAVPYFPG